VFAIYSPALRAGFIWDDAAHVTRQALRSFGGLWRIWFEPGATQQYYPLLHSFFWLEHRLWGDAALGYHLVNIALHTLAAGLLALLLRRLGIPGALLAAFVFALHPLQVESVAWISEQKNTLSTIFYLGAALTYLRFDVRRDWSAYVCALGLFVLALFTKTVTATLPAALLVVLWWQRGRLSWRRDVLPVIPWFALAASAGIFTAWVERKLIGAEGVAFDFTLLQRCLLAGRVVWFYFGKLLWPANLTFNYPRWSIDPGSLLQWLPLLATLAVLVISWRLRTRSRSPLAVALLFGGALFPVLGFFNVYPFQYSFVADHFVYVASIPVAIAVGATLTSIRGRLGGTPLPLVFLGSLGLLSWQQAHSYRDDETLFRTTIAGNPQSWFAHNNLGELLMKSPATLPEAITHLERAVALHPDYPEALNNLGLALTRAKQASNALPHLEKSLRLKPGLYQTHNNLGIALASLGRGEEAARAFQQAAALNPTHPNLHENWAKALLLLGRRAEADEHFALAARLRADAAALTPNPPTSPPKSP
jgi:Flp pilus assembly protein TadD